MAIILVVWTVLPLGLLPLFFYYMSTDRKYRNSAMPLEEYKKKMKYIKIILIVCASGLILPAISNVLSISSAFGF